MIRITDQLFIAEADLQLDFVRSSGPGGQNVNKVASAVQLRFNTHSASLPGDVRQRLLRLAGRQVNTEGELVIEASRFRTQEQNRQDALERLVVLLRRATEKPRVRQRTKVPQAERLRRLEAKMRRSERKKLRERL